jgi:hypothetical protein
MMDKRIFLILASSSFSRMSLKLTVPNFSLGEKEMAGDESKVTQIIITIDTQTGETNAVGKIDEGIPLVDGSPEPHELKKARPVLHWVRNIHVHKFQVNPCFAEVEIGGRTYYFPVPC